MDFKYKVGENVGVYFRNHLVMGRIESARTKNVFDTDKPYVAKVYYVSVEGAKRYQLKFENEVLPLKYLDVD